MCHLCEIAEKKVISLDEQKDRSNELLNFLMETEGGDVWIDTKRTAMESRTTNG